MLKLKCNKVPASVLKKDIAANIPQARWPAFAISLAALPQ